MHMESSASASIPVAFASADVADHVSAAQLAPGEETSAIAPQAASLGAPRILLAEDNDDLRAIARAFLQAEGYDVLDCADGERAIGLLQSGIDLDLLLTDIEMPRATGIEVAAVAATLHPKLPIVILSGAILMESTIQQMRDAGWTFFAKPFPLPGLLRAIRERLDAAGRLASVLAA